MKKVLLTIDGMSGDQKVFHYAISLCKRISAELSIFQIIRPQYYRKYIKKIRKNAMIAKKVMESTMVAATFAEAGEHETALDMMAEGSEQVEHLLRESEKAGVQCRFSITSGNPEKEIVDYVNDHRDVILTIYDAFGGSGSVNIFEKKTTLANIKKDLSVPVVTVHS
jgi:hypothetical protein